MPITGSKSPGSESSVDICAAQAGSKDGANGAAQVASEIRTNPAALHEENLVKHYIGEKFRKDCEEKINFNIIEDVINGAEIVKDNPEVYLKAVKCETQKDITTSSKKEIAVGMGDWEKVDINTDISDNDIGNLLLRASHNHYEAIVDDTVDQNILTRCGALMKKDYVCEILHNRGGCLSWNYPLTIYIPVAKKTHDPNSSNEDDFDANTKAEYFVNNFEEYAKMARSAAIARCRCRFPVPVILYDKRFICRSGTLAVRKGAMFETVMRASEPQSIKQLDSYTEYVVSMLSKSVEMLSEHIEKIKKAVFQDVEALRNVDVEILRMMKIRYICDLMVENRKIHTGMKVSSSEKINVAIYGEFKCLRMPYPGCEFFKKYSEMRCQLPSIRWPELVFDWKKPEVDSVLGVPEEESYPQLFVDSWDNYKTWNLETLTKRYFLLLIHFLRKGEGGLLVHCISGWDRTPLFVSLLRISLWADNLMHESLNVTQMAYLTLGYDWYLFGHHLPNRLKKQEEVMHFCFTFLPEISSPEYSMRELSSDEIRERRQRIKSLSEKLLQAYEENIPRPSTVIASND